MNRSQSENGLFDPQWLKVLKYFIGLTSEQKQTYADRLLPQQKQYLLSLFELYSKNNGIINSVYPADLDKHLLHKQGYQFKHTLEKLRHTSAAAMILGVVMITSLSAWMQRETIFSIFSNTQSQAYYDDWQVDALAKTDLKGEFDDPDQDGIVNALEFKIGTDPVDADTNQNGLIDGIDLLENRFDVELPEDQTYQAISLSLLYAQIESFTARDLENTGPKSVEFLTKSYQLSEYKPGVEHIVSQGESVVFATDNSKVVWLKSHVDLDRLNSGVEVTLDANTAERYQVANKNIVPLSDFSLPEGDQKSIILIAPVSFKSGIKYMRVVANHSSL